MRSRKVVKMKKSLYINIPSEIAEALEIRHGDRWRVDDIPGTGLLITPDRGSKKIDVKLESIERIKRAADIIYSQQEKRLRSLESSIISNIIGRLIPAIATSGIFNIRRDVDEIKKMFGKVNREKTKLILLRDRKKSSG